MAGSTAEEGIAQALSVDAPISLVDIIKSDKATRDILFRALGGLSANDRDLIEKRFLQGVSYELIALDYREDEAVIREETQRALNRLRNLLRGGDCCED